MKIDKESPKCAEKGGATSLGQFLSAFLIPFQLILDQNSTSSLAYSQREKTMHQLVCEEFLREIISHNIFVQLLQYPTFAWTDDSLKNRFLLIEPKDIFILPKYYDCPNVFIVAGAPGSKALQK